MAFNPDTFIPSSSLANSNAPRLHSYDAGADTLLDTGQPNYFVGAAGRGLNNLDFIAVSASDGFQIQYVSQIGGSTALLSALPFV